MTVKEKLEDFLSALDPLIESARFCAHDAPAFLKANEAIATLIADSWPAIAEGLATIEADAPIRAKITEMSEKLADLEAQTRARLVWADDFEDYIREVLSQRR